MHQRMWFRPKLYGIGFMVISWEGWVASLAYAAILGIGMVVCRTACNDLPLPWPSLIGVTWVGLCTGVFLWVIQGRSEGELRWRWGGRD